MMDLSVEAEAFGATIQASEDEVPTVIGAMLSADDDGEEGAETLAVPTVGTARTGLYVEAAQMAKERITDRPVLAGIIGPFSLAGRLMDVSEALVNCICESAFVHAVLKKATAFLKEYAAAYKAAGLDGIVMAEPLSGLLSPDLETEFSAPYVKEIVEAVQDDNFVVIYHNCGPNTPLMTESIAANGAAAFHFGDAVDLCDLLAKMPADAIVCGNISPSAQFVSGTPESMAEATTELLEKASKYPNFVLSSGCDIPPSAKWENIRAFFRAAEDFYNK
jgi:uroporphyrinogen decarboxylase